MSNENKKMTAEEKQQWDDLYQYVRKEVMQYDDNQSLSKEMVLRLKGLTKGKLMANNKSKNYAEYSYEVILYTFKACKPSISRAIQGKKFKNEMNKFLYISAIVENNINDIYLRVKNVKKSHKKAQETNLDNVYYEGAEYKKKTKETVVGDKFKDLW